MYSRDFGGIKSDGQLYNMEREYNESRAQSEEKHTSREEQCELSQKSEARKGLRLDFLRDLKADDLILIGIGLLLLLDSDGENDIFLLIIAFLLFF